jgi:hypothetical protein
MSTKIKKPKTASNWKNELEAIKWPKGKAVAKCGDVFLIQKSKTVFHVVYGLEVKQAMDYETAAAQFGFSVMHQATCEGLLDV